MSTISSTILSKILNMTELLLEVLIESHIKEAYTTKRKRYILNEFLFDFKTQVLPILQSFESSVRLIESDQPELKSITSNKFLKKSVEIKQETREISQSDSESYPSSSKLNYNINESISLSDTESENSSQNSRKNTSPQVKRLKLTPKKLKGEVEEPENFAYSYFVPRKQVEKKNNSKIKTEFSDSNSNSEPVSQEKKEVKSQPTKFDQIETKSDKILKNIEAEIENLQDNFGFTGLYCPDCLKNDKFKLKLESQSLLQVINFWNQTYSLNNPCFHMRKRKVLADKSYRKEILTTKNLSKIENKNDFRSAVQKAKQQYRLNLASNSKKETTNLSARRSMSLNESHASLLQKYTQFNDENVDIKDVYKILQNKAWFQKFLQLKKFDFEMSIDELESLLKRSGYI